MKEWELLVHVLEGTIRQEIYVGITSDQAVALVAQQKEGNFKLLQRPAESSVLRWQTTAKDWAEYVPEKARLVISDSTASEALYGTKK